MNEFPKTELGSHATMTHMAAEMIDEGDIGTALDVIDEVRAQLVEKMIDRQESIMKPDYNCELDDYFKHG